MGSRSGASAPSRRLVVLATIIILITAPGLVLASDQFTDVAPTNQFHDNINNLADAGITRGCGDGTTFCPRDAVNRQQMAGFLNRGLGRAATGYGAVPFDMVGPGVGLAQATVTTGGVTGGSALVVVTASVTAYSQTSTVCPCEVVLSVSGPFDASPGVWFDVSDTATPSGFRNGAGSLTWVFEAPSGTEQTYQLDVGLQTSGTPASPSEALDSVEGTITAVYVPFGPDGSAGLGLPELTGVDGPPHRSR